MTVKWNEGVTTREYIISYFGPEVINSVNLKVRATDIDDAKAVAVIIFKDADYISVRST